MALNTLSQSLEAISEGVDALKAIVDKIAGNLEYINISDMTPAERSIVDALVRCGRVRIDGEGDVRPVDNWV